MSQEQRSVPFQMRMQPSVKRAGELAARDDNRSLSSLLETLLIAHLRQKGYLSPAPGADSGSGMATRVKGGKAKR